MTEKVIEMGQFTAPVSSNELKDFAGAQLLESISIGDSDWDSDTVRQSVMSAHSRPEDPNYSFSRRVVRMIVLGLSVGQHMLLTGAPGAGKSSVVWQIAARCGIPVFDVGCKLTTDLEDLTGADVLSKGSTQFRAGPIAQAVDAVKHIHSSGVTKAILLIDEIDAANPAVIVGLNGMLDGARIQCAGSMLDTTGITVIATANTCGAGDSTGHWSSRQALDPSVLNRMASTTVPYISREAEARVIGQAFPKLMAKSGEKMLCEQLADAAGDVRDAWDSGKMESDPISTRQVLNLCRFLTKVPGSEWPEIVEDFFGAGRPRKDFLVILGAFKGVLNPNSKACKGMAALFDKVQEEVEKEENR